MKIFTSNQIQELDKYTIEHEPIKSIDLMERAAKALSSAIADECSPSTPMVVFAGPGNNGGDALAVARMLAERGYTISVFLFNTKNKLSEDCSENKQRALECGRIKNFIEVTREFDPPALSAGTYSAYLGLSDANGSSEVPVTLEVLPAGVAQIASAQYLS